MNIEEKFSEATKLIFGKALCPIGKYSGWLESRLPKGNTVKSALGEGSTYLPEYSFFGRVPKRRVVAIEDMEMAAGKHIQGDTDVGLCELMDKVKEVAYFVPNFIEGRNADIVDSAVYIDCLNIYRSFDIFTSKHVGYTFSCIGSEGLFGCYRIGYSKFAIHCYNSANLTSCFEIDDGKNCSNSMFCHNVEGVNDSMFCFNAKNKRYAVGNVEIGRENYLRIKRLVVERILETIEKKGCLDFDIYNVACQKPE